MSRTERAYVRLYHDDLLRDYPHVWKDDPALATFARLLVVADKMWPVLPELPRSVRRRALAVLTQANAQGHQLVELVEPHCYRIRGHDAERLKRQASARNAAGVRWDSERNADGNADGTAGRNADGTADAMPRTRTRTRRDEIPPPPAKRGHRKDETNPRANGTHPRAVGTNPRANGTSPRQEKRAGIPPSVQAILIAAAKGERA